MEQALRDADVTLWLPGEIPLALRRIEAGTFRMGSRGVSDWEEPIHRVQITKPYYIGTFPVTQAQYRAVATCAQELRLRPDPSSFNGDSKPVEGVSWQDAVAWCGWIEGHWRDLRCTTNEGAKLMIRSFGLPTEAQWEYACRAGTETDNYTGDGEAALAEAGWYCGNSGSETHPVGERKKNEWGLYDMLGNVCEWCRDAWDIDAYNKREEGAVDPEVTAEDTGLKNHRVLRGGSYSVLRGGSYIYEADGVNGLRASRRGGNPVGARNRDRGFRVCLELLC